MNAQIKFTQQEGHKPVPFDHAILFKVKHEPPLENPRMNAYYIPGLISTHIKTPQEMAHALSDFFRDELINHLYTGTMTWGANRAQMISKASEFDGHCLALKYRYRPLVECRAIAYYLLRGKFDVSLARVGYFFNVDHATVLNGLKSFNDWVEYVPEFKKKYERTALHFGIDF
jgi:hypothetical protein